MRRFLITAALAVVAVGAAAGCTTGPTPTPSATGSADETKAVCDQAKAYAATASAAILAKYTEGTQAIASGNAAAAATAAAAGKQLLADWSTTYKQFANKSIKPDVKTAITNIANWAEQTAGATSADPAALQATYADLSTKLATACAAP
jgi:hypothetical protein